MLFTNCIVTYQNCYVFSKANLHQSYGLYQGL